MFFFGVKKERKNLWGDANPKPRRPWRSGARGQLGLRIKRGFVNFGTEPFFFLFSSLWFCKSDLFINIQPLDFVILSGSQWRSEESRTVQRVYHNAHKTIYLHKHKTVSSVK